MESLCLKAVLFDLDNTLIDFTKMKRMSVEAAIDAMIDAGLDISRDEGLTKLYDLYEKHGIEYQTIFNDFLMEELGHVDYKILGNAIAVYRKTKLAYLEPYPHVTSTLTKLSKSGLKLGVITDASALQAWIRLCSIKLHHIFDLVITFDDTGKHKSEGLPFKKALRELNLKPKEVLMVGDWPERDIIEASKLGMKTVFARYGNQSSMADSGADYEINNFSELSSIIAELNRPGFGNVKIKN